MQSPWTNSSWPYSPQYNPNLPPLLQGSKREKFEVYAQEASESCITKGVISGVVGFAMGGVLGGIMGLYNGTALAFEKPEILDATPSEVHFPASSTSHTPPSNTTTAAPDTKAPSTSTTPTDHPSNVKASATSSAETGHSNGTQRTSEASHTSNPTAGNGNTSGSSGSHSSTGNGTGSASMTARERATIILKTCRKSSWSWAKNFGIVGGLFALSECAIEKFRAKHDIYNPVAAGCITGGTLAASAGPQAACIGCAGFAAFSGLIEYLQHMNTDREPEIPPSTEQSSTVVTADSTAKS
mmetsp:Transcript_5350/g.8301  ORF Transcript_5350/g.8301 Transcript_5350/m.8301 type:complete len:298 (+) Transcript_5350:25-918(+)